MIKVITFDLDDTLWDVRPALVKAQQAQNTWLVEHYPEVAERLKPEVTAETRRTLLQNEPDLQHHISRFRQRLIESLLLDAGVSAAEARAGAGLAFAEFIARRNDVAIFPEAAPVLARLKTDFVLGALTNGNADVNATPLGPFFSFSYKAEDVGAAKPAAPLFDAALAAGRCLPSELLHVGDSHEHDIAGARAMGAKTIWFTKAGMEDHQAHAVIDCLSRLPEVIAQLSASS